MADERDFELLDDYLTHHLSDADRAAFEQKLRADPDLRDEYTLQERVVQGIKGARVAELKSMLNKVPVPPNNPGNTLVSKVIAGTLVSLLIAGGGYWYFQQDDVKQPQTDTVTKAPAPEVVQEPSTQQVQPLQKPAQKPPAVVEKPQQVEADKNQTSAGTEHSKPSLAKRPDAVHAPAPGEKSGEQSATGEITGTENRDTASPLVVETNPDNTEFTFNYQFLEGKVVLYGPFKENQYEIIEYAGKQPALYLYYNDRYYALERADSNMRPLEAVTDPALLKELTEYRSSK